LDTAVLRPPSVSTLGLRSAAVHGHRCPHRQPHLRHHLRRGAVIASTVVRAADVVSRPRIDEQVPRRYYEQLGLISPKRAPNGYREYMDGDVSVVAEIRKTPRPWDPLPARHIHFIDCLGAGARETLTIASPSLAVYRDSLIELNHMIASLTHPAEDRAIDRKCVPAIFHRRPDMTDYSVLARKNLPEPQDGRRGGPPPQDGLCRLSRAHDQRRGARRPWPNWARVVRCFYLYPLTGRPGTDLPEGWDAIPGARGCSTEACDFRDPLRRTRTGGCCPASTVLSSQSPDYPGRGGRATASSVCHAL